MADDHNTRHKAVLSRPEHWDKMTPEEKYAWCRDFIAALRAKRSKN